MSWVISQKNKIIFFVFIVHPFISFFTCMAEPIDKEGMSELTEAIKDQTQLISTGHTETAQALYSAIQESGVADAAKAVPELAEQIRKGNAERWVNSLRIKDLERVQVEHNNKIILLEEARVDQQKILGKVESGITIALDHVKKSDENWYQIKGALLAFAVALCGIGIKWIVGRKTSNAINRIADAQEGK